MFKTSIWALFAVSILTCCLACDARIDPPTPNLLFVDPNLLELSLKSSAATSLSDRHTGQIDYLVTMHSDSTEAMDFMVTDGLPNGVDQTTLRRGCGGVPACRALFTLGDNESCCLMLALDGRRMTHGPNTIAPVISSPQGSFELKSSPVTVTVTHASRSASSSSTLSLSSANLALSIDNTGLNAALTGTPRQIVVTNTGSVAATQLTVDFPTWPAGTIASTSCGATLAAGSSCTITITPGATPTSLCSTGIAPTPGVVRVSGQNASAVTSNVSILSYGCIYQGGHLFSVDDTTPNTSSIGGKVLSQTDSGMVVWGSNGSGSANANVSYDLLPGIDDTSTSLSSSPTFAGFSVSFASNYTGLQSLLLSSFSDCAGKSDGQCNSSNIKTFYDTYLTNYDVSGSSPFTPSVGPTNTSFYAAGLCSATLSGYSDWYLPAICEMGPSSGSPNCGSVQNVEENLQSLVGDPGAGTPAISCGFGVNCLTGYYWTSTEGSVSPQNLAWTQYYAIGGSVQISSFKLSELSVRCARNLN